MKEQLSNFARSPQGATQIGSFCGTPLLVKGKTWLPAAELLVWGFLTLRLSRRHPQWSWGKRLATSAGQTIAILGSEWGHNLAHAAAAARLGKPADAIRITLGMPILIYLMPEHPSVTPRQHIVRSLAGPAFNAALLGLSALLRRMTRPESPAGEVAEAAVGMNLFLSTASLTPNPEIDGGPALKWALVEGGCSHKKADQLVKQANQAVGFGLLAAAAAALARRKRFLALICGIFALIGLEYGFHSTPNETETHNETATA